MRLGFGNDPERPTATRGCSSKTGPHENIADNRPGVGFWRCHSCRDVPRSGNFNVERPKKHPRIAGGECAVRRPVDGAGNQTAARPGQRTERIHHTHDRRRAGRC
jgi:hypothetical protein